MNDTIVAEGSGFHVIPEGKRHPQGTRPPCVPEAAQAHPEFGGRKPTDPLSEVRNAIDSLNSTEHDFDRTQRLRTSRPNNDG